LSKSFGLTVKALATGYVVKHHDAVARRELGDLSADCGHRSGGLMAKDSRSRVRAGGDLLQVRAANSAGVDFDQDFAGTDLGHRHGFQPYVLDTAIYRGQHG